MTTKFFYGIRQDDTKHNREKIKSKRIKKILKINATGKAQRIYRAAQIPSMLQ